MVVAGTAELRRVAGWSLVAGLCVSAAVAVVALLTNSWSDLSWRIVGTSLGFGVFTSTAAAGAALQLRPEDWARALGFATIGSSAASLATLIVALWLADDDWAWRAFGVAGLAALWTSHASLMLRARRSDDSKAVRRLTAVSVLTLGIDTSIGMLAVVGALDDTDSEPIERGLSVLLVITLLSTALPPILRRLQRRADAPAPAAAAFGAPRRASGLAGEVAEVAARLEAMDLPPRARAEVDRLRELARNAGG
jgi:MFS family permease